MLWHWCGTLAMPQLSLWLEIKSLACFVGPGGDEISWSSWRKVPFLSVPTVTIGIKDQP